jgi:hypothetical protein
MSGTSPKALTKLIHDSFGGNNWRQITISNAL